MRTEYAEAKDECCAKCIYWKFMGRKRTGTETRKAHRGMCLRNAPTPIIGYFEREDSLITTPNDLDVQGHCVQWPRINGSDWCGEFKAVGL